MWSDHAYRDTTHTPMLLLLVTVMLIFSYNKGVLLRSLKVNAVNNEPHDVFRLRFFSFFVVVAVCVCVLCVFSITYTIRLSAVYYTTQHTYTEKTVRYI